MKAAAGGSTVSWALHSKIKSAKEQELEQKSEGAAGAIKQDRKGAASCSHRTLRTLKVDAPMRPLSAAACKRKKEKEKRKFYAGSDKHPA